MLLRGTLQELFLWKRRWTIKDLDIRIGMIYIFLRCGTKIGRPGRFRVVIMVILLKRRIARALTSSMASVLMSRLVSVLMSRFASRS